jgi:hypothetical protein
MTQQSSTVNPAPVGDANTQQTKPTRQWLPVWAQMLPRLNFHPPEPILDSPLIDPEELKKQLKAKARADAKDNADYQKKADEIDADFRLLEADLALLHPDIEFLKKDALRLFRERDHIAKKNQNYYRLYQILFLVLAAVATALGSLQTLALADNNRELLAFWAFVETVIALLAVYLATISGREPPLPLWMTNRRRAEQLRREYFRFLMNLSPYDDLAKPDNVERRVKLSERAADINRGDFPDESGAL